MLGPLKVEAKALEESLLFAWDVGAQDVLFECDSKIVYDAVTGCKDPSWVISNITNGIQYKLQDFRQDKYHTFIDRVIALPIY